MLLGGCGYQVLADASSGPSQQDMGSSPQGGAPPQLQMGYNPINYKYIMIYHQQKP
jgi:hypothetical protein